MAGLLLTLLPSLAVILSGMALAAAGVFTEQVLSMGYVAAAARGSRSTAVGLYVTSYYVGGSLGGVLPAGIWAHGGWPGCVALVVAVQAALFAVDSPARQAFVPRLLPVRLLPAVNALKQVEFNLGVTVGPLLAGVLVARYGYQAAYAVDLLSFTAALPAVAGLPSMPPAGGGRRAGTASVLEGLAFLRTRHPARKGPLL